MSSSTEPVYLKLKSQYQEQHKNVFAEGHQKEVNYFCVFCFGILHMRVFEYLLIYVQITKFKSVYRTWGGRGLGRGEEVFIFL